MIKKYYNICPYICGQKWRRFTTMILFGMFFIFFVIKNGENISTNKQNTEKAVNFYDDKGFIIFNKKNINEISKLSQSKKEKIIEDIVSKDSKEKFTSIINPKINNVYQKNSSNNDDNPVWKKKHLCKVPYVIPPSLKQRRSHAVSACKRLRTQLPKRWRMRHIRWEKHLNLAYCHVPKAASTTWSWHLLRAIGLQDDTIANADSVHNLLKKHLPYPSVEDAKNGLLDSTLKFLVTRHPFERLVSAYQNKIADPFVQNQQYQEIQKNIIKKFYGDLPISSQPITPSFRDFCRYVIAELEDWMKGGDNLSPPDHHWSPQTHLCSPCKIRYHIFSDMSTLDSDTSFIAQQCGLEDVIKVHEQLNKSPVKTSGQITKSTQVNQSTDGKSNEDISYSENDDMDTARNSNNGLEQSIDTKTTQYKENAYINYFNQLDVKEIMHLYELYRLDFEIFNYDLQGYLKM